MRDRAEIAPERAPWEHVKFAATAATGPDGEPEKADGEAKEYRLNRYRRRKIAAEWAPRTMRKRFASCGKPIGRGDVGVNIGDTENGPSAAYQAIAHCASPWACPVCSAKLRAFRGSEVVRMMETWHCALGGGSYLVTTTVPHHLGDKLADLLAKMSEAWRWVTEHRKWKTWKAHTAEGCGLPVHYIRSLEITFGWINGWHPHHHMLLLVPHGATDEEAQELRELLQELWRKACEKVGLELPSDEHGVDVKAIGASWQADAAAYVAKIVEGFAAETANPNAKSAKEGNIVPMQLLDMGDAHPKAKLLWGEYVLATKGRWAVWTSRGLRAVCSMASALTDEEVIEKDEREDVHRVALIERKAYARVWDRDQTDLARALTAIEGHDWRTAARIFGCGLRVQLDVTTSHDPREVGREPMALRHDFAAMRQTARYIVVMRPEYLGEEIDDEALALVDNVSWRRLLPSDCPPDVRAERHRRGRASDGAEGNGSPPGRSGAVGTVASERRVTTEGKQMVIAI